jgi:ABC-2 type transport system ATP-binding protein
VETQVVDRLVSSTTKPNELAIDAEGLSKSYGRVPVLRDLTLKVVAGEIFGLIGPSGSGKSTTVQLLCGHLSPSRGTVRVLDEAPDHFSSAARRRIGYLPQQFSLSPDLTVAQNVAFAAGLYGFSARQDGFRSVLELTELWDARDQLVRHTSGGMQRRVALAAAIVHNPDLLFADEPTANLDPILRSRLWEYFRTRAHDGGTLLVTTQYIDEAEYCDRVGLMYDGALIAQGRPEELRRRAFGGDIVEVVLASADLPDTASLAALTGVHTIEVPRDQPMRATVANAEEAIPALLDVLAATGAPVRSVRQHRPTFDEVFIRLIEQHRGAAGTATETSDESAHTAAEHCGQGAA